jgi:membrane protease YdiL (CAAX protease family)
MTSEESLPPGPATPAEGELSAEPLTTVHWSVGSAAGLVAVALAIIITAGLAGAAVYRTDWGTVAQTLAVGALLVGAYLLQVAMVSTSAKYKGSALKPAVGLRSLPDAGRWTAIALASAVALRVLTAAYEAVVRALGFVVGGGVEIDRILPPGPLGALLGALLLVLIAPLAEEIVFRGVLVPALSWHRNAWFGIVVSGALFSAVHLNGYSFLPLMLVGVTLGWLFVQSRSLWTAVVAHGAFNAIGLVAVMVLRKLGLQ